MRIERREFIGITAAAVAGFAASGNTSAQRRAIDLTEKSVGELQSLMETRAATSTGLTSGYLARIRSIDKKLNSIIEINPEALGIAAQMDKERRAGKVRGPLHGIPIVIKDNIDTADKMKTTAGSLALLDAPTPKQDAFIVEQLRKAGAVIIAKTNLSEWANFRH
ncbi:MAG TPA: amidase family protein, partial [Pyrinomonadaceae bacterium]|nr:amidase family protein [Pyrinomonadaceae bacterium]